MCIISEIFFFILDRGKPADMIDGKRLPPPINTRNIRGIASALPIF